MGRESLFLLLLAMAGEAGAQTVCDRALTPRPVAVHRTESATRALEREKDLAFTTTGGTDVRAPASLADHVIRVNSGVRLQKMKGYGAALTEASSINLMRLPSALRRQALESLFRKDSGAGFDYIRLPVGASDFSDPRAGHYSYDDSAMPDPSLSRFSLARDQKSLRLIREAMTINPDLRVMISPWSAPAWMKTNASLKAGGLAPAHYLDHARYLVRTLQELTARGIPVESLTIQNEPDNPAPDYPSMAMKPLEQARFIRDFLAPELKRAKLNTGVFVLDHNYEQFDEVNAILEDPAVKRVVSGVAYHCYGGEYTAMAGSNARHPDVPVFQTECSALLNEDFARSFQWWLNNYELSPANMGSQGALAWNLVLDQSGGPHNGGCTNCAGLITADFSGAQPVLRFTPQYYALAQISAFVRRGAERVEVLPPLDPDLNSAAFRNPDGRVSLITWNGSDATKAIVVERDACEAFDYALPARTAVTFQWSDTTKPLRAVSSVPSASAAGAASAVPAPN